MSNIDKHALTDEAISKAFAGTNFGRDDFKNILAETVIDAAAGWRCGYTATTICTQLGLLTPKGCASALGLRFISEHVQRETKRLKDELEATYSRIGELEVIATDYGMKFQRAQDALKHQSLMHKSQMEAAEKRIAELEAKLETADKLQDSAFRHGLQHGFSLGQTDNQAGFEECLSAYGTRGKDNG
ncbi:hypothetical protein [Enterobacter kobei]|uniref:hypothetical protein n=1 Tax=Enterobacter kobei TaxID=208224 RepID=UPI00307616F9